MNDGALYQRANPLQRKDAKQMMDEYSPRFKWRPDGRDSLLDIGCGSGDVTVDFILPALPPTFSRLVGADISDGMLNYARKTFLHSKMAFEKLDIERPLDMTVWNEPFDHITSFYCLHWVQNQKQAMHNIYDLLTPDGDCLLMYLASHPYFEIYHRMSEKPRWAPYMTDVARYIPPYQYSSNAADEMNKILQDAGFADYNVQVLDKIYVFETLGVLKSKYYPL